MSSTKTIDIVGGGISGLTTAYFLAKSGNFEITLYEAQPQLGGLIYTQNTPYGIAEWGAAGWLNTTFMEDFIEELKLEVVPFNIHNKKKFIFRQQMSRWPLSGKESLEFFYHLFIKNRLSRTKLRPLDNETISQWGDRAIGPSANFYILQTALRGVYVGKGEELNASMILDHHFYNEQKNKPLRRGTIAPIGGMSNLIKLLAKRIQEMGVTIKLKTPFVAEDRKNARLTIYTVALPQLTKLLPNLIKLKTVTYDDLTTVTTFHSLQQSIPHGFGCLFTPDTPSNSIGAIFSDGLFHHDKKFRAIRWIFRGLRKESAEQLIKLIQQDFLLMTDDRLIVEGIDIKLIPSALPCYDHLLKQSYEQVLKKYQTGTDNIYIHGNFMKGIGLSQIIEKSHLLAQTIITQHG